LILLIQKEIIWKKENEDGREKRKENQEKAERLLLESGEIRRKKRDQRRKIKVYLNIMLQMAEVLRAIMLSKQCSNIWSYYIL